MKKRIVSIIMALSMCLSMLPPAAFAAEADCGHTWNTEGVCTDCGVQAVAQLTAISFSDPDDVVSYYTNLQAALDAGAALTDRYGSIKLLDDVAGNFTADGPITTIDLNGKTITAESADTPALKITDGYDSVYPCVFGGTIQSSGGTALEITGEMSDSYNPQFFFGTENNGLTLSGKTAIKASDIALNLESGSISATENAVVLSSGATVEFSGQTSVDLDGAKADFAIEGTYTDAPLSFDTINMPGTVYTITMENPGVFAKPSDFAPLHDFQLETSMFTSAMEGYVVVKDGDDLKLAKGITEGMVTISAGTTYNGNKQEPSITVAWTDSTSLTADTDYTVTWDDDTFTNAKTYTATITGIGGYTGEVQKTYTIGKATPIVTAPTAKTSLTYTGQAQELIAAGSTTGGTLQYSLDNSSYSTAIPTSTNAGNYTVYYKVVGNQNYNDVAAASVNVTIGKAAPTVTEPTASDISYGQTLSASTLSDTSWKWTDGTAIPTITNSGYEAYVFVDDTNYDYLSVDGYDSADHTVKRTVSVTVSKATPGITLSASVSGTSGNRRVELTATMSAAGGDLPTGTVQFVNTTGGGSETIGTANISNGVATYTWTATEDKVYTIQAVYNGDANYLGADASMNVDTSKQPQAALTINSGTTVTYGQTLTLATSGGSSNGAVTYTVQDGSGAATISGNVLTPTQAGTVTVTATMAGNDSYLDVTSAPVTITIVQATGSGSVTMAGWTYGETASDPVPTSTTNGTGSVTYLYKAKGAADSTYTAAKPTDAGTYTVKATFAATVNYTEATATVDFTITDAAQDAPAAPELSSKTYNSVTLKTITTNINGAAAEYSKDGGATWQSSPTFTGLSSSTKYNFVARYAATGNFAASPASAVTEITTNAAPSGGGGYTPPSTPSTPPTQSVTVPISGDDNTIHVGASVTGDKATVDEVDLSKLDTVIGDNVSTGTVTIDFSNLDSSKPITTVELPSDVVKQIAQAVNDPANDAESLEVILSDGTSIEFDAEALGEKAAQADGLDITISIEHHETAELTGAQKDAVGDRPAYDINVTSGDKHISDMGGRITVHAPYELKPGEIGRGLVVWYVDDHGNRERCETSYDPVRQRVNWKTDHLSLYMIDYDEVLAESCPQDETCPIYPFTDTDINAWYHDGVHFCIENGLMGSTSTTESLFAPNTTTSRAMIVTILHRLEGTPASTGANPFSDVPDGQWYTDAVIWAAENGITSGTGDGTTFSPNDPIAREQLAVMLWRYAGSPAATKKELDFTDADEAGSWAVDALIWAQENGVMVGNNNAVDPKGNATRSHVAQMLMRFIESVITGRQDAE